MSVLIVFENVWDRIAYLGVYNLLKPKEGMNDFSTVRLSIIS
jgi:hypothetical protein